MADEKSSPSNDPLLSMPVSGWPVPQLYPFAAKDMVALMGQLLSPLTAILRGTRRKRPSLAAYRNPSLGKTLQFRFLHVASFMVILPMIVATRLLPSHWRERHDQSVFVETNNAVLTALGFAFMA